MAAKRHLPGPDVLFLRVFMQRPEGVSKAAGLDSGFSCPRARSKAGTVVAPIEALLWRGARVTPTRGARVRRAPDVFGVPAAPVGIPTTTRTEAAARTLPGGGGGGPITICG